MLRRRPYVNLNDRATFVIFKIYSRALLYILSARQICPLVGSVKFDLSLSGVFVAILPCRRRLSALAFYFKIAKPIPTLSVWRL